MAKSAVGTIDDKTTGWKFTGVKDPTVGFYLKDLSHDGHFFANSIRLELLAAGGFVDGDAYRPRDDLAQHHVFRLSDCTQTQAPELIELSKKATDPLGYYNPRLKAVAKYELKGLVYETDQKLELELAFLFTAYNKDPSHEPGAVIPAARVYPTLTFNVVGISHKKKKPSYRHCNALQALFRININLEEHPKGGDQIGLFTDIDDLGPLNQAVTAHGSGGGAGSFFFTRAEKPLVYEVVGKGVIDGGHGDWDNIHQWSHPTPKSNYEALQEAVAKDKTPPTAEEWMKKALEMQPPTPGLPYGGHIHWRWARDAVAGVTGLPGGKQYGGPQGAGTPLIDDRINNQTIEFAIVDGDGWFDSSREADFLNKLEGAPPTYLFKELAEVWKDLESQPAIVWPTFDPIIWMSIFVKGPGWGVEDPYREFFPASGVTDPDVEHTVEYVTADWGGTMFAHGIFFPHEDISYLDVFNGTSGRFRRFLVKNAPGVAKPQYVPKSKQVTQDWER